MPEEPVTIKTHLLALMDEREKKYNERFAAIENNTAIAFASSKEAVLKAEAAAEKRFESVNEFRATLAAQQATLVTRAEVDLNVRRLDDKIDTLTSTSAGSGGIRIGADKTMYYVLAAIGIAATVVSLVLAFRGHV